MAKIAYRERTFQPGSMALIEHANAIIEDYSRQGYRLTLRQLYYQFVSRDLIPNKDTEYKRLGSVINDARLAGYIDWTAITDHTRELRGTTHWEDPRDIVRVYSDYYHVDKWEGQEYRPEVWVEKDALRDVVARACGRLDVDYFSCRGYVSQSEMWEAGQRLVRYAEAGQTPIIFHLGDHDPSGKDMTRDIVDRLELFMDCEGCEPVSVDRLALNMDQVREFNPPPNPAKITDSRATAYIASFGRQSWELDALDPTTLAGLIESAVMSVRDEEVWDANLAKEKAGRAKLKAVIDRWEEVTGSDDESTE